MGAKVYACLLVAVTALLILLAISNDTPPRLQILVSPHTAFAPATVVVLVRLRPMVSDDVLDVAADSGEFFRSSTWSLDGAKSNRLFRVEWRDVPAGDYVITARVVTIEGVVSAATASAVSIHAVQ